MVATAAPMPPQKSTNVRAATALAATVAPGLMARWAIRRFCTPPRHALAAWERVALATARSRAVPVGGYRVQAWTWGDGPAVLLVHGWGGRGSQLAAFVPPLVAAGHAVVAFDAPAHGASPGRRATLLDFRDAIHAVAATAGPVHGLVAHSLGATASVLAIHDGVAVGRAAFLAPPADPVAYFRRFLGLAGLPASMAPTIEAIFERRGRFRWREVAVPPLATALGDLPLLVVHDQEDPEVPWDDGAAIAAAWPGAELVTTEGLGHRKLLRAPQVVARVLDFVAGGSPVPRSRFAPADPLERELFDRDSRWTRLPAVR